ncbi:MAG: fused MFS/spermidine synthase [Xanthobacteraceae bacterium]|nr:fused MFS/spermidine synthase [Xanthobacteraceae bacterium]QYK43940.1 MAG: fused MFS/spermidine synthase [Xanthobacteraceae bacterium]
MSANNTANETPKAAGAVSGLLLPLFALAIFVSAALLFFVQPMFAKMVLPRFGGAPAVWSVAMVFFQSVLLAGYAYAHFVTRNLQGRHAIMLHLAVMCAALVFLPLGISSAWGKPPATGEAVWLLGLFAASIGLPFFALSANGPLLQAWFARTDHPAAKDPYFLYAASNIGSFLALLAYPFVFEPLTRLPQQTLWWSGLFVVLIVLIAGCGYLTWNARDLRAASKGAEKPEEKPTWSDAMVWVALSAIPSGLLIAATNHISTDVAAVPFLWVVPLALYLLTFVIVFSRIAPYVHTFALVAQPIAIMLLIGSMVFEDFDLNIALQKLFIPADFDFLKISFSSIFSILMIHVSAFFLTALVCHGELARTRPAPAHLTEFYMWMSAGGTLGGILAALVAPQIFNWVAEYPILIVLALLCRPGWVWPEGGNARWFWLFAAVLAALAMLFAFGYRFQGIELVREYRWFFGVLTVLAAAFAIYDLLSRQGYVSRIKRPETSSVWSVAFWVALAVAAIFILLPALHLSQDATALTLRDKFGDGAVAIWRSLKPTLAWVESFEVYENLRWIVLGLLVVSLLLVFGSVKYAYVIGLCFLAVKAYENTGSRQVVPMRSFFGVHKITDTADGRFRVLLHGTTIHGAQRLLDNKFHPVTGRPELTTYYYKSAAIAQAVAQARLNKKGPITYAVVGLGTGTLACHKQPTDTLHYYEIDPTIIQIATKYFSFLSQCAPDAKFILGDARLTMADAPDGIYDFLIIDAFSSDAIPIHLLTREAVEIYKKKLSPKGILVMHVSNRHLELASVVAGIANANGMTVRVHNTTEDDEEVNDNDYKFSGTVTAAVRDPADFGALNEAKHWKDQPVDKTQWVWSDDYQNVIGSILRHRRGE